VKRAKRLPKVKRAKSRPVTEPETLPDIADINRKSEKVASNVLNSLER
jgi:hypothetical protein